MLYKNLSKNISELVFLDFQRKNKNLKTGVLSALTKYLS